MVNGEYDLLISFDEFYRRLISDTDPNNFYRLITKPECQGMINEGYGFFIYNLKSIKYIGFDNRSWI
jgi:hypothetical protein